MFSPNAPIRLSGLPCGIMSQKAVSWLLPFTLFIICCVTPLYSGHTSSQRKSIYKVDPDYPQDLKRAYIGGTVRLNIVISPSGTVEAISILGGNPVLAEAAIRAVKK